CDISDVPWDFECYFIITGYYDWHTHAKTDYRQSAIQYGDSIQWQHDCTRVFLVIRTANTRMDDDIHDFTRIYGVDYLCRRDHFTVYNDSKSKSHECDEFILLCASSYRSARLFCIRSYDYMDCTRWHDPHHCWAYSCQ